MAAGSRPPNPRPVKRTGGPAKGTAAKGSAAKGTPAKGTPAAKRPAAKTSAGKPPSRAGAAKQASAKQGAVKGFAHGPVGRTAGRPVRNSVSQTSAQRFAARVRARRRRRVLIVIAVVLVLNGLAWVAVKSPWATVQKIEVTGTDRVSIAAVRAEAEAELGHPMLLARTADIATRVGRQKLVRSVQVRRHWPSTIRIQVLERVPVAALPAGSSLSLVDRDGVEVERVKVAPAGLPRLEVDRGAASVPALRGSLAVLQALPSTLSQRLLAIGADSPDGIWLKLRDSKVPGGARVEWGDSAQSRRKAQVLMALLPQHAVGYDVRSPDTPAVRRK
jgi:cell division protein FtsQ